MSPKKRIHFITVCSHHIHDNHLFYPFTTTRTPFRQIWRLTISEYLDVFSLSSPHFLYKLLSKKVVLLLKDRKLDSPDVVVVGSVSGNTNKTWDVKRVHALQLVISELIVGARTVGSIVIVILALSVITRRDDRCGLHKI